MRRTAIALLVGGALHLPNVAHGATLEASASAGVGRTFTGDDAPPNASRSAIGFTASASLLYRSSFLLSPWVEVGHADLSASRWRADVPGGSAVDVEASIRTQYLSVGPALDVGRFRVRAGISAYRVEVISTVLGVTIRPTSTHLGWFLAASYEMLKWNRLHVAPELRALVIEAGATVNIAATLNAGFDLVEF